MGLKRSVGLKPSSEKPISSKLSEHFVHFTIECGTKASPWLTDCMPFGCRTNKRSWPKTFSHVHWNTKYVAVSFLFSKRSPQMWKINYSVVVVVVGIPFRESTDSIYLNSMYICGIYVFMYILVDPRKDLLVFCLFIHLFMFAFVFLLLLALRSQISHIKNFKYRIL